MKTLNMNCLPALIGAALLAGTVNAQQTDFPRTGTDAASCAEVDWNADMIEDHPRLIDACQEVISAGGTDWARFEGQFNRVNRDGTVSFSIRDARNRIVEDVTFNPTPGQVAYISNRPVAFRDLSNQQLVNLYVPEGRYGFSTSVDAPVTQLATVVADEPTSSPAPVDDQRIAATEREDRSLLPATASKLPWMALGGMLMVFGSLGLGLVRRNG